MSILLKGIKFAPTQHFLTTYSFYKLTGHRVKGVGGGGSAHGLAKGY